MDVVSGVIQRDDGVQMRVIEEIGGQDVLRWNARGTGLEFGDVWIKRREAFDLISWKNRRELNIIQYTEKVDKYEYVVCGSLGG